MKNFIKKIFIIALTINLSLSFIILSSTNVYATGLNDVVKSAIDNFAGMFKSSSEEEIEGKYDSEFNKSLTESEEAVKKKIEEIYSYIEDLDLDSILKNIDYNVPKEVIENIKDFFNQYEGAYDNVQAIISKLQYKIEDVTDDGKKVTAKITYTYPKIDSLIKKVMPEILFKNFSTILKGNINNDILNSAISSIRNEMDRGTFDIETNTYDFKFAKKGNDYKLVDVRDIEKNINAYIENLRKSIFS